MHDFDRHSRRRWVYMALPIIGISIVWVGLCVHTRSVQAALVSTWPADLQRSPKLLETAMRIARPVYATHCALCHGTDLTGNRTKGVSPLSGPAWLYGGDIADLENTIRYGVRSGDPRSHNVTDMPAAGRTQQLSASQIADVVEYLLSLTQNPHDESAAQRGDALFHDQGNCFDCHGNDAKGNTNYGSPSLRGPAWIYGGDRQALYQSIYSGRHGLCPAWNSSLSAVQIRALAAFIYVESHPDGADTRHL